jgi:hypothetical protein
MQSQSSPSDRRRRARYTIGLPVRVHLDGIPGASEAELQDISATGCFLRSEEVSFLGAEGERLAFGFVTASRQVGLVRGRVVRRTPGQGLGVVIEQANQPFDELLGTLAATEVGRDDRQASGPSGPLHQEGSPTLVSSRPKARASET